MKLEKYKSLFLTGDWHTHSKYSDGDNSPEEIIKTAINLDLKLIAITDHVNNKSNWLENFELEINNLKDKYRNKITVLSGIEAKVVDLEGNIDANDDFFDRVDIVMAAFHRIPIEHGFMSKNKIPLQKDLVVRNWKKAMMSVILNPNVDIIAHPTNILKLYNVNISFAIKKQICKAASKNKKIFEYNISHNVPDLQFVKNLRKFEVPITIGSDAHNIDTLRKLHEKVHKIPNYIKTSLF
jgi:HisJ family histidinol phosphate phosphatase